jgi:hypothetical protein
VGEGCRTGQIIDRDKIDLGIAKRGAENVPANAAEAVDTNLNCHVFLLLRKSVRLWVELVQVCCLRGCGAPAGNSTKLMIVSFRPTETKSERDLSHLAQRTCHR